MKINEGLLAHDLDFTIMPLISIDEYRSKIDDRKVIVVGFYVTENDPAIDLAAFIEKGIVKVLDTDVSPAPTEDGYYLVFVELDRDDTFPKKLLKIINEINNITNIKQWEFSPLHSKQDENYPLTLAELRKHTNLDSDSVEIDDDNSTHKSNSTNEQIARFLKNALIDRYDINNNTVIFEQNGLYTTYNIEKFDYDEPNIPILIGNIGDIKLFESNCLQNILGPNYSVYSNGTYLIVTDNISYMLLTPKK